MESSISDNPKLAFKILENILRQTYGEEDMQLIYKFIENKYGLPQSEFSNNIDIFAKGLEIVLEKFTPRATIH